MGSIGITFHDAYKVTFAMAGIVAGNRDYFPTYRLQGNQRDFICPITDLWTGITSCLLVTREESGEYVSDF